MDWLAVEILESVQSAAEETLPYPKSGCGEKKNKVTPGFNQKVKPHRDTDLTFGKNPTILGLSIGETRKIRLKRLLYDSNNLLDIFPLLEPNSNTSLDLSI